MKEAEFIMALRKAGIENVTQMDNAIIRANLIDGVVVTHESIPHDQIFIYIDDDEYAISKNVLALVIQAYKNNLSKEDYIGIVNTL